MEINLEDGDMLIINYAGGQYIISTDKNVTGKKYLIIMED